MAQGEFREDLYRLNVSDPVPPLRERREEIRRWPRGSCTLNTQYGRQKTLSPGRWPSSPSIRGLGNVRELENMIRRRSCRGRRADFEVPGGARPA
jgi:transcriptional regulator with GAF, ATPase, and Fis domain